MIKILDNDLFKEKDEITLSKYLQVALKSEIIFIYERQLEKRNENIDIRLHFIEYLTETEYDMPYILAQLKMISGLNPLYQQST